MKKPVLAEYWQERVKLINHSLDKFLPMPTTDVSQAPHSFDNMHPPVIFDAMRYSLLSSGKRVRPVMLMAAAEAVGAEGTSFLPTACALEMIHAYSLVHDDLPAMDNDDYRRGKFTNHKVYGEAIAILAGDGLLSAAFATIVEQKNVSAATLLSVIGEIATAAGAKGMIGGQTADLLAEGKQIDMQNLKYIHQAKTGALFKAAIRSGALLGGAGERELAALDKYASSFGLAFQITDDILDVSGKQEKLGKNIGSDARNQKATYVTIYSLEEARIMAKESVREAKMHLEIFGEKAWALRELAQYLLTRET